jgi:hypothetical protein
LDAEKQASSEIAQSRDEKMHLAFEEHFGRVYALSGRITGFEFDPAATFFKDENGRYMGASASMEWPHWKAAWKAAQEECAQIAEKIGKDYGESYQQDCALEVAERIRGKE